jgi:hypothetical protein
MEFLGHSRKSAPLAVGTYGHVTDATFDAARRAVDSSLFALRPVQDDGTAPRTVTTRPEKQQVRGYAERNLS